MESERLPSRMAFLALAGVLVVAMLVWMLAGGEDEQPADANVLLPNQPGPSVEQVATSEPALPAPSPEIAVTPSTQPADPHGAILPVLPTVALVSNPPPAPANAPAFSAEQVFQQATSKRDQGDIVTARNLMNEVLISGKLSLADVDAAKAFIADLNSKIIFSPQRFTACAFNRTVKVEPGSRLTTLARPFEVPWQLVARLNNISDPSRLRAGITLKSVQGPFHAVISKSTFTLDLYLGAPGGPGSMYVRSFSVGLGADASTPTGTWIVMKGKIENPVYYSPRGEGVIGADDPANPLGERWIPLEGIEGNAVGQQSYGIHGTIEPESIGKNMSLGCVRLLNDDVELLYDLLTEGKSKVKVIE